MQDCADPQANDPLLLAGEPLFSLEVLTLQQKLQVQYFQKYRADHERITKLYQLMEWFHEFYSKQLHLDQMGVVGFRVM